MQWTIYQINPIFNFFNLAKKQSFSQHSIDNLATEIHIMPNNSVWLYDEYLKD